MVHFRTGAAIVVKGDPKILKHLFIHSMIAVHNILWRHAFLLGCNGDRNTMLIGTTDKGDFSLSSTFVATIKVRGEVSSGKVTKVNRSIGIG